MITLFQDYLDTLNSEIIRYEQILEEKKQFAKQLNTVSQKIHDVLTEFKTLIETITSLDTNALAFVKDAALSLFNVPHNTEEQEPPIPEPAHQEEKIQPSEAQTTSPVVPASTTVLSKIVTYDAETKTVYLGINNKEKAKIWGDWLCYVHSVGERFEIKPLKNTQPFKYQLVVKLVSYEDATRLAQCDLTKLPDNPCHAEWKPTPKLPIPTPRPKLCHCGDLAIGDMAANERGKLYRVIESMEEGKLVKVLNEDDMAMILPVEGLYLHQKAEDIKTDTVKSFSPSQFKQGQQVTVITRKYPALCGLVGKIINISKGIGAFVEFSLGLNKFLLFQEIAPVKS